MDLLEQINKERLPKHVAIIMDGNGRWAKKQGFLRAFGHESGTKSVKEIIKASVEIGIENLTQSINTISVCIQNNMTIDELAFVDFFFQPHFNKPWNFINLAGLNSLK